MAILEPILETNPLDVHVLDTTQDGTFTVYRNPRKDLTILDIHLTGSAQLQVQPWAAGPKITDKDPGSGPSPVVSAADGVCTWKIRVAPRFDLIVTGLGSGRAIVVCTSVQQRWKG